MVMTVEQFQVGNKISRLQDPKMLLNIVRNAGHFLILLNMTTPTFANSVDQMASSGSTLFVIQFVN